MQSMSANMTALQRFSDRVKLFASRRRDPAASSQPSASAPLRVIRDDVDFVERSKSLDDNASVVVAEVDVTLTMSVVDEEGGEEAAPIKELTDMDHLRRHLELMHDRCIARNLRAAGLGTFEAVDEQKVYGMLSPRARMADTGESMLWAVINRVHDSERQCRYIGILVVEKADVNEQSEKAGMMTPLMVCCQRGLDKCAKALLQSRYVDHALRDDKGNTALHYMALHGRETLLKHYFKVLRRLEIKRLSGKDVAHLISEDVFDIRNGDDLTPYKAAVHSEQLVCAAMLEEEKSKRVKLMNKGLSLVQHVGSPSLSRSMQQQGRKLLKRIASFDSLRFDNPAVDDLSDEEFMLSSSQTDFAHYNVDPSDNGMRPRVVTWHGRKPPKEKKEPSGSPMPSPLLLSRDSESPTMNVNVGVRVADASRRAHFFQSKGEMMRDTQATSSTPKAMGRSVTVTGNLSSASDFPHAKPKLTDRIRNFLRRKPRYGLHGSSSVDNLTAYREEAAEPTEPPPIGLFGDDISHMRSTSRSAQPGQRLRTRRESQSLSKMEAMVAASRLKERQQTISVNISASVQLPRNPDEQPKQPSPEILPPMPISDAINSNQFCPDDPQQ